MFIQAEAISEHWPGKNAMTTQLLAGTDLPSRAAG